MALLFQKNVCILTILSREVVVILMGGKVMQALDAEVSEVAGSERKPRNRPDVRGKRGRR